MKVKLAVVVAVLSLSAGTLPVSASDERETTSPVMFFRDPDPNHVSGTLIPGAFSTLERETNEISMEIHTSMLPASSATTVWWVIFNEPSKCSPPGCAGKDLSNPAVKGSVSFATGEVIGADGVGDFSADLKVGDLSGCQPAVVGFPCVGLMKPLTAEVHYVIRSHGLPIAGLVDQQIGSFAGGCKGTPVPPFAGPTGNSCFDVQASVHKP